MKKTRALFIGRFQPLHKGHLHALKAVLAQCDFVTIGIGSVNNAGSGKNPFTYEERRRMLLLALKGVPRRKFSIIPIPDFFNDRKWAAYVTAHAKFDVVVTGSRWVRRCLKGKAVIRSPDYYRRKTHNSTRIRGLMRKGSNFASLLPASVFNLLKSAHLISRVAKRH